MRSVETSSEKSKMSRIDSRKSNLTRQRSALRTSQQNDIQISYVHKAPARRNKKPALPETPVTLNKERLLEIEDIEKTEKRTQTEPETIMKTDNSVETPIEMSLDYEIGTSRQDQEPIEYWILLAEKRRLALVDRAKHNKDLRHEISLLKERLNNQEQLEQEAQYFAFLYRLCSEELH